MEIPESMSSEGQNPLFELKSLTFHLHLLDQIHGEGLSDSHLARECPSEPEMKALLKLLLLVLTVCDLLKALSSGRCTKSIESLLNYSLAFKTL